MAEFSASLDRHYPAALRARGVAGTALVDVHVAADGRVEAVDVVSRPGHPEPATHRAVLRDARETSVLEINDRPEFGVAAQAALRETRFEPALNDGEPVPYMLRMTVQFDPVRTGEGVP
jgi:TonB family protein